MFDTHVYISLRMTTQQIISVLDKQFGNCSVAMTMHGCGKIAGHEHWVVALSNMLGLPPTDKPGGCAFT
jgi:hypothetical protein